MNDFAPSSPFATDQADGLRRLFAGQRQRLVPLVANPHVDDAAILLERLASALAEGGARLLVVDAADTSPAPHELVDIDLAGCIETLGPGMHYLAACGLPRRHVNARGSAETWLQAIESVATRADAIVLHANARDLARLVGQRDVRPVLMCGVGNQSLTDAYTSMKLLAQRARLMSFDLLVSANGRPQRAEANAQRLALTGDHFLGAVVRGHAAIDCRGRANAPLTADLQALARAQLGEAAETGFGPIAPSAAAWNAPAACPELSSLLY